jgi:hypothetical protein
MTWQKKNMSGNRIRIRRQVVLTKYHENGTERSFQTSTNKFAGIFVRLGFRSIGAINLFILGKSSK